MPEEPNAAGNGAREAGVEKRSAGGDAHTTDSMPPWRAGLEEDLQRDALWENDPLLKEFAGEADLPKVLKGYIHAQRLIGQKGVIIPKKDAPPEEWEKFHEAMGRPKEAAGYKIGKPADWPEDLPYQEEIEKSFRENMFQAGVPAATVEAVFKWYTGISLDQVAAYQGRFQEQQEAAEKALRKKWGPDYDNNFRAAGGMLVKHGGEDLAKRHDLANDPEMLEFLYNLSRVTGEDQLLQGGRVDASQTLDDMIQEVEGKMKEMVAKGTGGDGNPEYVALRKRRDRLYDQKPKGKEPVKQRPA